MMKLLTNLLQFLFWNFRNMWNYKNKIIEALIEPPVVSSCSRFYVKKEKKKKSSSGLRDGHPWIMMSLPSWRHFKDSNNSFAPIGQNRKTMNETQTAALRIYSRGNCKSFPRWLTWPILSSRLLIYLKNSLLNKIFFCISFFFKIFNWSKFCSSEINIKGNL